MWINDIAPEDAAARLREALADGDAGSARDADRTSA